MLWLLPVECRLGLEVGRPVVQFAATWTVGSTDSSVVLSALRRLD